MPALVGDAAKGGERSAEADAKQERWAGSFERQEIWVMNTEYRLFGPDGPRVRPEATHAGRLDELAKCLAASPGNAAVRLFWADAVVSIEGPGLGEWMTWVGQRAPSEQGMVRMLMPNIEAASRGAARTRTVKEAQFAWYNNHGDWKWNAVAPEPAGQTGPPLDGQPVPGVFVWRAALAEGEEWIDGAWDDTRQAWVGQSWPTGPLKEYAAHFLANVTSNEWNHVNFSPKASQAGMGVLLEYSGANLRFGSQKPLTNSLSAARRQAACLAPEACVTVLGGPKGMSEAVKDLVRDAFKAAHVPLVEVCLGPREQMAHACVGFLRIQDDAGLYRSAAVDLLRLGKAGYEALTTEAETSVRSRLATWSPSRKQSRSRSRECAGASAPPGDEKKANNGEMQGSEIASA